MAPDTLGRYPTYERAITRAAAEREFAGNQRDWDFCVRFRDDADGAPWAVIAVNLNTEREEARNDEPIDWA